MSDATVQITFTGQHIDISRHLVTVGTTLIMDVPPGARLLQLSVISATPAPPEPTPAPAGFNEHVLTWVREKRPAATAVESVSGYGTGWEGDTQSGFSSVFDVEITYLTEAGKRETWEVTGEDLDSLWHWVVNGWRKD